VLALRLDYIHAAVAVEIRERDTQRARCRLAIEDIQGY